MGNVPGTAPPDASAQAPAPSSAKSQGAVKFHLACGDHGPLGEFDSEPDALQAAADHLHKSHSAAVAAKVESLEVQISQSKHFGVKDLDGYEPSK